MRLPFPLAMLLLPFVAGAAPQLDLDIGRVQAPGWRASGVHARLDGRGSIAVDARTLAIDAVPLAQMRVHLSCGTLRAQRGWRCEQLRASAQSAAGSVFVHGALTAHRVDRWQLEIGEGGGEASFSEPSGRYAADRLGFALRGRVASDGAALDLHAHLELQRGQSYVEPVFEDFAAHPARVDVDLHADRERRTLTLAAAHVEQDGVAIADLAGAVGDWSRPLATASLDADLRGFALEPGLAAYVAPFVASTRFEGVAGSGAIDGHLQLVDGALRHASLVAHDAHLQLPKFDLSLDGLAGGVAWASSIDVAAPSQLRWRGGAVGRLALGGGSLDFVAAGRGLRLLQPAFLPVLDGGVRVARLEVQDAGLPQVSAAFDASLEPISLPPLCAALGWPQFGGRLSGRVPGLTLRERELSLGGALTAEAFDGRITVDHLRVLDPLGVLPRITADVTARNIDLRAATGAFSFGRIEGRLDADVEGLKLIGWQIVEMRAHLQTPSGDTSRHRISQRAIDNISSLGGGPGGVLSRGFLRFFEDFGYDRIGWSCVLANGVCRMDGLEPAADGRGYVLVKGRLLPRIDVVGYSRAVAWSTFVQQLLAARAAGGVEVR